TRVNDSRALAPLASRHLLVFALMGIAGTLVLRGIGAPVLATAFALNRSQVAAMLTVLSLALPFDMLVWHAAWYLLTLGRSRLAASLQVLGLVLHGALALPLVEAGVGADLGYALVVALAVTGLVSQLLLSRALRAPRLTLITGGVVASTAALTL